MSGVATGDGTAAPAAPRPGRPAAYRAAAAVVDPELRVVTIEELGILRDVTVDPGTGRVVVTITPTYAGCPAMDAIRAEIRRAVRVAGYPDVEVRTSLRPAWSTDMISESGRAKLATAGVAPPDYVGLASGEPAEPPQTGALRPAPDEASPVGARPRAAVPLRLTVRCPRCGSPHTEELSHFGSTACKALWRCLACTEPFEHVKAL